MNEPRLRSTMLGQICSRRMLLLSCGAGLLGLVGCADQASDRQFAGDLQTAEPGASAPALPTGGAEAGSPTAVPTPLPVSELLAPRGVLEQIIATRSQSVTVIDVTSGAARRVWQQTQRVIWARNFAVLRHHCPVDVRC